VPVRDVVAALPVATELRDGHDRTKFKHWVDADRDGCNTRAEVLLTEAATTPTTGAKCAITGGESVSTCGSPDPREGQPLTPSNPRH
jgi:hypothetical protein